MKNLYLLIIAVISFTACTKNISSPTGKAIFFKDENVEVENMMAVSNSSNMVNLMFTVAFESSINRIELMSSKTPNTFCTIKAIDLPANFSGKKSFSFCDSGAKANTMYYLLRFKKNNSNWIYSPYLTVTVK